MTLQYPRRQFLALGGAGLATGGAWWLSPPPIKGDGRPPIDMDKELPSSFAGWRTDPSIVPVMPADPGSLTAQLYNAIFGRGYVSDQNELVIALAAYGARQTDQLQVHRPEVCYRSVGFDIEGMADMDVQLPAGNVIPATRVLTRNRHRAEIVTYWMRIGPTVVRGLMGQQLARMEASFARQVPDGVLFRISTIGEAGPKTDELHVRFLNAFLAELAPDELEFLVGERNVALAPVAARARGASPT